MTVTVKASLSGGSSGSSGTAVNPSGDRPTAPPNSVVCNALETNPDPVDQPSSPQLETSTEEPTGDQLEQPIISSSSTHLTPSVHFSSSRDPCKSLQGVMHRTTSSPDAREEVVSQDHESTEESHDSEVLIESTAELTFPVEQLARLDDMINRPRWVIPVLPRGELEVLLDASLALASRGLDVSCEPCQRFYKDGIVVSFTKILTDDAVTGWKTEIHVSTNSLQ